MSERSEYPHGVPCWVDTFQADPEAAGRFYGAILGWELSEPGPMPDTPDGRYYVARLRGRDVAGIGSGPSDGTPPPPSWVTSIAVDSADAAAERAREAGGTVIGGPFDVAPAGRLAVLADAVGAMFVVWEARERQGAQLVNETGAWAISMLVTSDPERAARFYGDVFGWTTERFGEGEHATTVFRLPGYVGGEPEQPVSREVVAVMSGAEPGAAAVWNADFWVDDVDAAVAAALDLGGRTLLGPFDTPVGRTAVLADPAGVSFSVSRVAGRG